MANRQSQEKKTLVEGRRAKIPLARIEQKSAEFDRAERRRTMGRLSVMLGALLLFGGGAILFQDRVSDEWSAFTGQVAFASKPAPIDSETELAVDTSEVAAAQDVDAETASTPDTVDADMGLLDMGEVDAAEVNTAAVDGAEIDDARAEPLDVASLAAVPDGSETELDATSEILVPAPPSRDEASVRDVAVRGFSPDTPIPDSIEPEIAVADPEPASIETAALAPPPAPAVPPPSCVDDIRDRVETIEVFFGVRSVEVSPEALRTLRKLAVLVESCADAAIVVEGHADQTGDELQNLSLSWRRAEVVAETLTFFGAPSDRTETIGFGARRPASEVDTTDGHALNRRVGFSLRSVE